MAMTIHYCRSWFRMKKVAIEPMNKAMALSRHHSGQSYTALVGSTSAPSCFVELAIDKGMVGVGFLDKRCREYLTYQFRVIDTENLFLTMATHREFEGDKDGVKGGECYVFNEDGGLVIIRERVNPYELKEAKTRFDPCPNYERLPQFGCYSHLIKTDR